MMRVALILAVSGLAPTLAQAQVRSGAPGHRNDRLQVPRAALPQASPKLGGVRAGFPQTNKPRMTPRTGPEFRPMPVGPWPGTVIHTNNGGGSSTAPTAPFNAPAMFNAPAFNTAPYVVDAGGTFIDSSAIFINGSYSGDRFRFRFHIGSDPAGLLPSVCKPDCNPCPPIVYWYPGWWYNDYGYDGNRYGTFAGYYSAPDPNLYASQLAPTPAPVTQAVTPSSDRDLGDTYLRAGDARAAIKSYKNFLKKFPGDEQATRSLGVALLDLGQTAEGVAVIATAYTAKALLAFDPIPDSLLRDGQESLRRNIQKASIYANRVKSSAAWLTVTVLMQAQGRNDLARTMLDRAQAAGLDKAIFDRMSEALR